MGRIAYLSLPINISNRLAVTLQKSNISRMFNQSKITLNILNIFKMGTFNVKRKIGNIYNEKELVALISKSIFSCIRKENEDCKWSTSHTHI